MWIITCDGRAVNSDHISYLERVGNGTYAHVVGVEYAIPITRKQNIIEEIVRNSISNTPAVDYRGAEYGY